MRYDMRKVIATCMAGATVLGTFTMPAEASGRINAGITAVLGESLAAGSEAYKAAAGQQNAPAAEDNAPQQPVTICGYTNLGMPVDTVGHVNIRSGAGEDTEPVGKLPGNAGCEILGQEGNWYRVQSKDVTGYIRADLLLTGEAAAEKAAGLKSIMATSHTQTLNARTEPNTECRIWTTIAEGETLNVLEDLGDWIKVDIDGDACYVAKEFVTLTEALPTAMNMTEIKYGEGVSDVKVDMIQYACQFVGNRYVWGGTSLTDGVDCSGFTMRIYEKYGISLPHSSKAQANYGARVDSSDAQPGDLFFYGSGDSISHVAMYIGNGQVVHASSAKTGIKISNAFYRSPICVTRLLED